MKNWERSDNFKRNMHTLSPSGIHSAQLASYVGYWFSDPSRDQLCWPNAK